MAGTIRVGLAFNYGNFAKGVKTLQGQINSLVSSIRLLAVGQMVNWAQQSAAAVGQMVNGLNDAIETAEAFGMSFGEFQRFRMAAAQNGLDAERLGTVIQNMTQAIADAAAGNKKAAATFIDLGVDINALAEMSAGDKFLAIADAAAKMNDELKRSSIVADIFGAKSFKLNALMRRGGGEFRKQMSYAPSISIGAESMSRSAVDSWVVASEKWKVLSEEIAIAILPAADAMTNAAENLFQGSKAFILFSVIGETVRQIVVGLESAIDLLRIGIAQAMKGIGWMLSKMSIGPVGEDLARFGRNLMDAEDELISGIYDSAAKRAALSQKAQQRLIDAINGEVRDTAEIGIKRVKSTGDEPLPEPPKRGQFMSGLSSMIASLAPSKIATDMVASVPIQSQRRDYAAEQLTAQRHTAAGIDRLVSIFSQQPEYAQA